MLVVDVDDSCPDEPEVYNGNEDEDGCPDISTVVVTDCGSGPWAAEQLYFDRNRSTLSDIQRPVFQALADILLEYPQVRFTISGHAAEGERYPDLLAAQRANAIREELMAQGIEASQLEIESFGATRPIRDNSRVEGRRANRRVEVRPIPGPL